MKSIESLEEIRKDNYKESERIFLEGEEVLGKIVTGSIRSQVGREAPLLADMSSDFGEAFSLRCNPEHGKMEPVLLIDEGFKGFFRQKGISVPDVYTIEVKELKNIPYIYSFIKTFSISKADFKKEDLLFEEITKYTSRLPSNMFSSKKGVKLFKQFLKLYINTWYNENMLIVKTDEEKQKLDLYKKSVTTKKIDKLIANIQRVDSSNIYDISF